MSVIIRKIVGIRVLLLALMATTLSAAQVAGAKTVTLRIKKTNAQTEEKIQTLEKVGPSTYRLKIAMKDISRDIDTIDAVLDTATAKKGEEGYFVVSTGCWEHSEKRKACLKSGEIPCRSSA